MKPRAHSASLDVYKRQVVKFTVTFVPGDIVCGFAPPSDQPAKTASVPAPPEGPASGVGIWMECDRPSVIWQGVVQADPPLGQPSKAIVNPTTVAPLELL